MSHSSRPQPVPGECQAVQVQTFSDGLKVKTTNVKTLSCLFFSLFHDYFPESFPVPVSDILRNFTLDSAKKKKVLCSLQYISTLEPIYIKLH